MKTETQVQDLLKVDRIIYMATRPKDYYERRLRIVFDDEHFLVLSDAGMMQNQDNDIAMADTAAKVCKDAIVDALRQYQKALAQVVRNDISDFLSIE